MSEFERNARKAQELRRRSGVYSSKQLIAPTQGSTRHLTASRSGSRRAGSSSSTGSSHGGSFAKRDPELVGSSSLPALPTRQTAGQTAYIAGQPRGLNSGAGSAHRTVSQQQR
eukprot:CAMPEP_0181232774 /NCGR_PEP_ID=MMETSP1096-20121128/35939_1 /TAXON_ID=156174 ORGANISM="Chrysochromulina ericina, Strain CCMP281" /NCGR_SAMPLE_ID=MMETSP1096 /ASSEMBLY_ACC=CAM_ASM_000453 /LENGTH=112 /DNA_ID=CAMNT_0023327145 /DNA_START=45 /DNA_END=383 /DNA_ORIENTATION=+